METRGALATAYAAAFKQDLDSRIAAAASKLGFIKQRRALERVQAARLTKLAASGHSSQAAADAEAEQVADLERTQIEIQAELAVANVVLEGEQRIRRGTVVLGMLKQGIPDLLDRTAGKQVRDAVARAIAAHAGEIGPLHRLRSRRSGRVVFIELALDFEPSLPLAEVNRRIEALKESLRRDIGNADVSVLALPQEG